MKKAVLEIMDYAAEYKGNFLSSVLMLSYELEKENVETVFVFPERAKERAWAKELSKERNVVFLPDSFLGAVKVLKSIFIQYEIISVHSHFLRSNMYLPLKTANLFKRVPHYFHAHSMPRQSAKNFKTILRRYLLSADAMICVSDGVAQKYSSLGFKNCITVKNSICFSRLDNFSEIEKEKNYTVLMFGYDFHIKGIDTAIEAFDKFDVKHDLTLCICVASHMEKAEEYINGRFGEIPSWIKLLPPREDVASYMRSADVFLSASRTEGFAYAVAEAAYCEAPLVLSDITAHRELSIPDALMFSPEDEKGLYDSVIKALTQEKTNRNRLYVEEQFSIEKWISEMCSILI